MVLFWQACVHSSVFITLLYLLHVLIAVIAAVLCTFNANTVVYIQFYIRSICLSRRLSIQSQSGVFYCRYYAGWADKNQGRTSPICKHNELCS